MSGMKYCLINREIIINNYKDPVINQPGLNGMSHVFRLTWFHLVVLKMFGGYESLMLILCYIVLYAFGGSRVNNGCFALCLMGFVAERF